MMIDHWIQMDPKYFEPVPKLIRREPVTALGDIWKNIIGHVHGLKPCYGYAIVTIKNSWLL